MDDGRHIHDKLALHDLVNRYAGAVDRRDTDAKLAMYLPDGILVLYSIGATEPTRTVTGHEDLGEFFRRSGRAPDPDGVRRELSGYTATSHLNSNHLYDVDGDTAMGSVDTLAHHIYNTTDGPQLFVLAEHYDDTVTRTPAGWRFARRVLSLRWMDDRPMGVPPRADRPKKTGAEQ